MPTASGRGVRRLAVRDRRLVLGTSGARRLLVPVEQLSAEAAQPDQRIFTAVVGEPNDPAGAEQDPVLAARAVGSEHLAIINRWFP